MLLATSQSVLAEVLRTSRGMAPRLEQAQVFRTASAGLPAGGDLVWFSPEVGPKVAGAIVDSGVLENPDVSIFVESFAESPPEIWYVERTIRTAEGVLSESNSPDAVSGSVRLIEHYCGMRDTDLLDFAWKILPDENAAHCIQLLLQYLDENGGL